MLDKMKSRGVLFAAVAGVGLAALVGCSSNANSNTSTSPTTTSSASASQTATNAGLVCNDTTILAALPSGAKMVSFHCANVSGDMWAAAKVNPGGTVYFLRVKDNKWTVIQADEICGTASAGLPPSLLAYCATPSPTATNTIAPATCTQASILGALPNGSSMVSYKCANVGGTKWAAAKVNPGPTVFFLHANGSTWQVQTADEICGTASAGLPDAILAFCK